MITWSDWTVTLSASTSPIRTITPSTKRLGKLSERTRPSAPENSNSTVGSPTMVISVKPSTPPLVGLMLLIFGGARAVTPLGRISRCPSGLATAISRGPTPNTLGRRTSNSSEEMNSTRAVTVPKRTVGVRINPVPSIVIVKGVEFILYEPNKELCEPNKEIKVWSTDRCCREKMDSMVGGPI